MENVQKPKVGAGIKTMSILQLVFSGFGFLALLGSLLLKDQIAAQYKTMGINLPVTPTSTSVISLIITTIIILSVILILMKKELGIYIYFIAIVANRVYSIVTGGFSPWVIIMFIVPVLMGIFIWKKKEIFSVEAKNIEV